MEDLIFQIGDRVRHKQLPSMEGVVVKVSPIYENKDCRVYWRGWHQFLPETVDWTWGSQLEKIQ